MKQQAGARKKTCYYKTLGISVRATQQEIRSAFRYLAMKLHPDRNPGNPSAAERFREVRKAYETLKDPAARGRYDRLNGHRKQKERFADSSWTDIHSEGGEAASFDEIFQDLFGIGKRHVRTRHGSDLRFDLQIARSSLQNGGFHEEISYVRMVFCQCYNGAKRSGCRLCGGIGEIEESCSLKVWIPAGIANGTRIRLSGAGDATVAAAPPGDLVLFVYIIEGC
ncbi:MAG: DnaJ domain-containing protein [Syntrophobacteraceae bacterium]|nr:DnaJ domain-containing protein [Syntrophobacteraceae bacterium]